MRVIAIDQQGQGASDPDPKAVNPLRIVQVATAAQMLTDPTHKLHTPYRGTALSRAKGQLQSQVNAVDANRTQGASLVTGNGAPDLLRPGTSPKAAKEQVGMKNVPPAKMLEHLHSMESSAFAPPVGGTSMASNATALSAILNATKASPPVILVTSKVGCVAVPAWPAPRGLAGRWHPV